MCICINIAVDTARSREGALAKKRECGRARCNHVRVVPYGRNPCDYVVPYGRNPCDYVVPNGRNPCDYEATTRRKQHKSYVNTEAKICMYACISK